MTGDNNSLGHLVEAAAPASRRWYVIRTLPRQEATAEANLHRQGIRVFVPKVVKTIRHARKMITRRAQFFPGYGFVEMDLTFQKWRSVNGTIGVAHLIMAYERPLPVPPGVIEDLIACSGDDGVVDLSRRLAAGSAVRIRTGLFTGATGVLAELDEKGRVEVLLQIMNGQVRVKTAQDMLEPHKELN